MAHSDFGDTTHAGYIVAVTPVTNAIPADCAAPAGVLTYLDLPPHGARGLLCHAAASAANTKGVDAVDIDACDLGKGDVGAPALRVGGVSRDG